MVMKYYNQGSLADYLGANQIFPSKETCAKRVILWVAKALNYLHSMHVIHRDVKFENILVAANG